MIMFSTILSRQTWILCFPIVTLSLYIVILSGWTSVVPNVSIWYTFVFLLESVPLLSTHKPLKECMQHMLIQVNNWWPFIPFHFHCSSICNEYSRGTRYCIRIVEYVSSIRRRWDNGQYSTFIIYNVKYCFKNELNIDGHVWAMSCERASKLEMAKYSNGGVSPLSPHPFFSQHYTKDEHILIFTTNVSVDEWNDIHTNEL